MKKTIYNNIKDLSASSLYELGDCIEALYEMLPLEQDDCDEVWLHNRLRHILECILTDEAFSRLYDEYHDFKLAYIRQAKLLKRALDYLDSLGFIESDNGDYYPLYNAIDAELKNPLYSCREKKKGGV